MPERKGVALRQTGSHHLGSTGTLVVNFRPGCTAQLSHNFFIVQTGFINTGMERGEVRNKLKFASRIKTWTHHGGLEGVLLSNNNNFACCKEEHNELKKLRNKKKNQHKENEKREKLSHCLLTMCLSSYSSLSSYHFKKMPSCRQGTVSHYFCCFRNY